jgi:integrase
MIPGGPKALRETEKVRTRLLNEVDERRHPRTSATVGQLMDRFLKVATIEETTRSGYRRA